MSLDAGRFGNPRTQRIANSAGGVRGACSFLADVRLHCVSHTVIRLFGRAPVLEPAFLAFRKITWLIPQLSTTLWLKPDFCPVDSQKEHRLWVRPHFLVSFCQDINVLKNDTSAFKLVCRLVERITGYNKAYCWIEQCWYPLPVTHTRKPPCPHSFVGKMY